MGIVLAAANARALGEPAVSALELGVAGGAGLLAVERIAAEVQRRIPVQIQIFGLPGSPETDDIRDMPQLWAGGDFRMDAPALQKSYAATQSSSCAT
jgi:hypothetical protein